LESRAETGEGVVHGPLRGASGGKPGLYLVVQRWVLGDHRLGLQHIARGAAGGRAPRLQLARDGGDRLLHAGALLLGAERARGVAGGGGGLGHAGNRAEGDPRADSHTADLCHPTSSSRSEVSSAASESSVCSAPSPSAVSVT